MKTKYSHPPDAIQQYTEICLQCGKNTYDSDECVAPTVQKKAKLKPGDHIVSIRPKVVTLHLAKEGGFPGSSIEKSKETYRTKGVVLKVCDYHYNCYKVTDRPHYSFICSTCITFENVKLDSAWKMFNSSYSPGDTVLVKHPAGDSSSSNWNDIGDKASGYRRMCEDGLVTATLKYPIENGLWYCLIPRILNHGPGSQYSLSKVEKIYHESEFRGPGRQVETFREKHD